MQTFKNRGIAALGAIVATLATVAASSPARAETMPKTFEVKIGDVDLGSKSGAAIVDRRLRHAAAKVCGPMDRSLARSILVCRREAMADAKLRLAASPRVQYAAR